MVAVKLTREVLSQLLLNLGRVAPFHGERLYREESYAPRYEFGEGDYLIMDIDPSTDDFKVDKDGIPLVRTVYGISFESTHNLVPLGSRHNPIKRDLLVQALLPIMQTRQADPAHLYQKVAPTLVLYPNADELTPEGIPSLHKPDMQYHVATDMQTLLQTKSGQTFQEAMVKTHGKALLMNFCTPFLEVYPKDKLHCAQIYNMEELEKNVVPETSVADLAAYIKEQLQLANPLTPYVALDANRVAEAMGVYRNATGRYGTPWRLAYNKTDAVAVGIKLSRQDLTTLLQGLGRTQPFHGERLYREESFDPRYEFGEGDYLLMDIDPSTQTFKLDKAKLPLLRTVNETAFECTYNTVLSRSQTGKRGAD